MREQKKGLPIVGIANLWGAGKRPRVVEGETARKENFSNSGWKPC